MRLFCIYIIIILLIGESFSQQWKREINLRGKWKFMIGDNKNWIDFNTDDSKWEDIYVPSAWENEGYPGYNGYAWYKKHFYWKPGKDIYNLYLSLGKIDDVDEVYLNGHLVGSTGTFPPEYQTAYDQERFYRIAANHLHINGDNVITVRVYDAELAGGILSGKIGIYSKQYDIDFEISLEGIWKFSPGDQEKYKSVSFDDTYWNNIIVPAQWESQGFADYDGYAWYRKKINIPTKYIEQKLVLLLGKIDDMDETFLNGERIGSTGHLQDYGEWSHFEGGEWLQYRAYELDEDYIYYGQQNTIAVRVFDGMVQGGIYEGPVGIVTYESYLKWKKREKKSKGNFFEWLFGKK
ncbi:beta galactosidase jelly roll domain-containing protein [Calditrichota bacterium]